MAQSQARPSLTRRLFAGLPVGGVPTSATGATAVRPGAARHLFAVAACPGKFAVAIPAVLVTLFEIFSDLADGWPPGVAPYLSIQPAVRWWAIAVAVAGTGMVVWTNVLFHRNLGTLHPDDGPRRLVTSGPYAYTRNPMILGIFGFLVGVAGTLGSWVLAGYTVAFALLKTWYLRNKEEPHLEGAFGEQYAAYRQRVPYLWLPWRRR